MLGNTERERGRPAEAATQLARAAQLRQETGNPREEAWALAGGARVLARGGEPAAARELLERALVVWRRLEDRRALAWHLLERSRLDLDLGAPEDAERALDEATRLALAIELPYTSEILRAWSRLEAERGAPAAALLRAEEAVAAARRAGNDEMLWRALVTHASAAAGAGRPRAATEAIAEAQLVVERLQTAALAGDEGRIAAVEERLDGFEEAIGVLFDLGRGEEALLLSEQARSRALLDRLGAHPVPSLAAVAAIARRRHVDLLELFTGERRSFAWLVTRAGRIEARALPVARARLEALVADASNSGPGGAEERRAAADELSRLLLAPFAATLGRDRSTLAVAAHGPLLRLSFAALPETAGRPLAEIRASFAIPSIGFLAGAGRATHGEGYLLLADPEPPPLPGTDRPLPRLAGARREAAAIAALLADRSPTRLEGAEASEERLRALAPGARLIHIAAHGLPDDEQPLAGRLALAAGAGEPPPPERDGLWSAREALELGLRADLVVLSACSGARGRLSGEGALGFGVRAARRRGRLGGRQSLARARRGRGVPARALLPGARGSGCLRRRGAAPGATGHPGGARPRPVPGRLRAAARRRRALLVPVRPARPAGRRARGGAGGRRAPGNPAGAGPRSGGEVGEAHRAPARAPGARRGSKRPGIASPQAAQRPAASRFHVVELVPVAPDQQPRRSRGTRCCRRRRRARCRCRRSAGRGRARSRARGRASRAASAATSSIFQSGWKAVKCSGTSGPSVVGEPGGSARRSRRRESFSPGISSVVTSSQTMVSRFR